MDLLLPTNIEPRRGLRIWIEFNDGLSGEIDLSAHPDPEARRAWADRQFFEQVHIDESGEIVWNNHIQLCPETLYAQLLGLTLDQLEAKWQADQPEPHYTPNPTHVEPRPNYRIWLQYDDGVSGEIDLSHLPKLGLFQALQNRTLFEQVHITKSGAIGWTPDLELCPDSLYIKLTGIPLQEFLPQAAALLNDA